MKYERRRAQERCIPTLMVVKWLPGESGPWEKWE